MTLLLDVNVVLGAHRDDHPCFPQARPWLDDLVRSEQAFSVPSLVWGSFLRLATDRRVFVHPRSPDEAFAFIDSVRAQPGFTEAEPGPRHLDVLKELCREGGASGKLVPDAILAAIAIENACEIVTMDRDFARFPSVRHQLLA